MNFEITTLNQRPDLYDQLILLIEECFGYEKPYSFAVDFAPLLIRDQWSNNSLLLIDGELSGHIGKRVLHLEIENELFPIDFLGGICVRKKFRGQGHFSKFFQDVLKTETSKTTFTLLWSDLAELYKKYHFYQIGEIAQTGERPLNSPPKGYQKTLLKNLKEDELARVKELYNKMHDRYLMPKRSDQDWERLALIESADLYLSSDAYFFINKGQDLQNTIHEFGTRDFTEFLATVSPYQLWLPLTEEINDFTSILYLGLMKAGDEELFSRFIHKWSQKRISISRQTSEEIEFHFDDELYTLTPSSFLMGLWGPEKIEEFSCLGKDLFISGLDSI